MALQEVSETAVAPTGLRAARAVCKDRGISDVTLWRWRRSGWIKCANIAGKIYVNLASLAEFDRRANAGEFSKKPNGAAARAADARAAREQGETV